MPQDFPGDTVVKNPSCNAKDMCLTPGQKLRSRMPQSLKEISPEYSLVGLMLKLKLQYFDHLL